MKQINTTPPALRLAKRLLLSALFLGAGYASTAQVYYAHLSSESTTTTSPGTGSTTVTISGNTMRVQANFSGLLGNTTASHIHAPTALAFAGTAGVATTIPTFPGFPLGVKSGTYDHTFDMTQASSYNPAYITANGGTPASAFAALKAAMNAGKSYLNIHTTSFPGGEIRGFLLTCPSLAVAIPDAFALAQGTLANTVYPAYAPAASLVLSASVSGGTAPYSYSWSTGSTASTVTVSPATTTTYTVTVQDQNGCPGSASKTVQVMDVASGKKGDKVDVCHLGRNTLSIAAAAVAAHLDHGDMLGACPGAAPAVVGRGAETGQGTSLFAAKALTNPSAHDFTLQFSGNAGTSLQLRVYDAMGRVVESRTSLQPRGVLRIGGSYTPGMYIVEIVQNAQKQTLRLIKTK